MYNIYTLIFSFVTYTPQLLGVAMCRNKKKFFLFSSCLKMKLRKYRWSKNCIFSPTVYLVGHIIFGAIPKQTLGT